MFGPVVAIRSPRLPLVVLLAAGAVSQVGSALTLVAVPWFVLQTTGQCRAGGPDGGGSGTAVSDWQGVFGGAWVDRVGFRRASILGDLTSGTRGRAHPAPLCDGGAGDSGNCSPSSSLATLCDVPGATARRSLIPSLAALARHARSNAPTPSRRRFRASPRSSAHRLAGVLIALTRANDRCCTSTRRRSPLSALRGCPRGANPPLRARRLRSGDSCSPAALWRELARRVRLRLARPAPPRPDAHLAA